MLRRVSPKLETDLSQDTASLVHIVFGFLKNDIYAHGPQSCGFRRLGFQKLRGIGGSVTCSQARLADFCFPCTQRSRHSASGFRFPFIGLAYYTSWTSVLYFKNAPDSLELLDSISPCAGVNLHRNSSCFRDHR